MAIPGAVADTLVAAFFPPELEKQMKIENLFVTWQQRSAQSNMPISVSAAQAGGWQAGPSDSALVAPGCLWQRGALKLRAGCMPRDGVWQQSHALCLNFWGYWALAPDLGMGPHCPALERLCWRVPSRASSPLEQQDSVVTACSQAWRGMCACNHVPLVLCSWQTWRP